MMFRCNVAALLPAASFVLLLLLSGCVVGPDYEPPEVSAPQSWQSETFFESTTEAGLPGNWWELFNDAELNGLIAAANANNRELKAAYRRFEQALAFIQSESSRGRPGLNFQGSYERFQDSRESGDPNQPRRNDAIYGAALTASWELDVFGRVARLVEAAEAEADGSIEAMLDFRLLIQTRLADTYFELRSLAEELRLIERSIEIRSTSLETINSRFRSGTVSDLDVAQAEALLAITQADAMQIKRRIASLTFALAVLVGEPAPNFTYQARPIAGSPPEIPAGLPSELLRRRPDIRQAEMAVKAANAQIGVAQAAFYPRLTLASEVGVSSTSIENLAQGSAGFWSIGPQLSVPLFQGYSLRAREAVSKARYQETLETYQNTVLQAFAEVETALASTQWLLRQRDAETRAVTASSRARTLSQKQYRGGVIDFITSLDAERTALDAERRLAQLTLEEYRNAVALIRALGGSWQPAP